MCISRCLSIPIARSAAALDVGARHAPGPGGRDPDGARDGGERLRHDPARREGDVVVAALAVEGVAERSRRDDAGPVLLVDDHVRHDQSRVVALGELRQRHAVAGEERSDVDERCDPLGRQLGRLRDRDAAHAVPDEHDRARGGFDVLCNPPRVVLDRHLRDRRRVVAVARAGRTRRRGGLPLRAAAPPSASTRLRARLRGRGRRSPSAASMSNPA